MRASESRRRYRRVDAALLRASAHTSEVVPGWWPEHDDGVERWQAWIAQAWTQPVAEAVRLASPALAGGIQSVCEGARPAADRVRQMAASLARYLIRMSSRATPFGMFAGVSVLRFGDRHRARWSPGHHTRTRADGRWLAGVIARLESSPELRRRVLVVLNDLTLVRGERLVVPWQPHATCRSGEPVEVSVRLSRAVQTVVDEARLPILAGDLVGKLAAAFPDAPLPAMEELVAGLVGCGVLVTELRPPSTSTDGLAHVLQVLDGVSADVAEVAALVAELRAVREQLAATDRTSDQMTGGPSRHGVAGRMRALAEGVAQPLMVDLRVDATVVLPERVVREAESAADALLRLAPNPAGDPAWRAYHSEFLERYGPGVLVSVVELVDPTVGLGYPGHFPGPLGQAAAAVLASRDERLLALAQLAASDGALEVVLDEQRIDELSVDAAVEVRPVPHVDLCVEVHAATMAELAGGAFMLAVTGVGRTAICLTGRFLELLPEPESRRIVELYHRLPVGVADALPVQLSFPPIRPDVENVTRVPLVLPGMVSLAEHHPGQGAGECSVGKVAVTADAGGLYLVSLPLRRVVEPVLPNAAALHTMPALGRFLFELPRACRAPVTMFSWGAAACLPFLPRVRYGRSILAPARWRIPAGELPGPCAPWSVWTAAIAGLRGRLGLPTVVSVGRADQQLRLNLDEPMGLSLLRAHLDKEPDPTVREASTPADHGWLGGRAHEIVVPLAATTPPARSPAVVTGVGPLPLTDHRDAVPPGGRVLFAKLYAHPDVFDTILTVHLPRLLPERGGAPMWWFLRYQDPRPHLRLRFHLDDYGQGTARLGRWASDLRRRGMAGDLVLDTYHPETGRYGTGAAMAAAEALFAADSTAVLAQLTTLNQDRQIHPYALSAASLVDLAAAVTGDESAGMRWLLDHPELADQAHVADREMLRQAISLAGLRRNGQTLDALAGGAGVRAAWQARRHAAAGYVDALAAGPTHLRPRSVLVSLLHLHHVRAHGIGPVAEARTHRLARAIALAWKASQPTAQEQPT